MRADRNVSEKRNSAYLNARFKYILFLRTIFQRRILSSCKVQMINWSPCQPVHEQEDVARACNAMAEAWALLQQTSEKSKVKRDNLRFDQPPPREVGRLDESWHVLGLFASPGQVCSANRCKLVQVCSERKSTTWPTSTQFRELRDTSGQVPRCSAEAP